MSQDPDGGISFLDIVLFPLKILRDLFGEFIALVVFVGIVAALTATCSTADDAGFFEFLLGLGDVPLLVPGLVGVALVGGLLFVVYWWSTAADAGDESDGQQRSE